MEAVQQILVLPFTLKPSLRSLGFALTELTLKTIPSCFIQSIQLYVDGFLVNDDIRMMRFINGPLTKFEEAVSDDGNTLRVLLPSKDRIIALNLKSDELIMQNIQIYQQIIAPFVQTALESLTHCLLPVCQEHLPRVFEKIIKRR